MTAPRRPGCPAICDRAACGNVMAPGRLSKANRSARLSPRPGASSASAPQPATLWGWRGFCADSRRLVVVGSCSWYSWHSSPRGCSCRASGPTPPQRPSCTKRGCASSASPATTTGTTTCGFSLPILAGPSTSACCYRWATRTTPSCATRPCTCSTAPAAWPRTGSKPVGPSRPPPHTS